MQNMTSFEAVMGRLLSVTQAKSASAFARILNIIPHSVVAAIMRKKIPPAWLVTVPQEFQVTAAWLFFGTGPMRLDPAKTHSGQVPEKVEFSPVPSRKSEETGFPELEERLRSLEQRNRELEKQLAEAKDEALKAYRLAIEAMRSPVEAVQVPPPSPYAQPIRKKAVPDSAKQEE